MALAAVSLRDYGMSTRFQEYRLGRRMRVMAVYTGCGFHRVVSMGIFECLIILFMTGEAKGNLFPGEEIGFVRGMG